MALGDLIQSLGIDPLTGQSNLASPEAVKRQRELAAALGKEGMNYSPIQSPWQGAARLAQALSSGIDDWRANKSEAAGRASDAEQRNKLAEMLGGQTAAPQTLPAPSKAMTTADASPASSDPTGYRDAIASIESKGPGQRRAIGPKLGQAIRRLAAIRSWAQTSPNGRKPLLARPCRRRNSWRIKPRRIRSSIIALAHMCRNTATRRTQLRHGSQAARFRAGRTRLTFSARLATPMWISSRRL